MIHLTSCISSVLFFFLWGIWLAGIFVFPVAEGVVLDWNKPSRNVYKSMGAKELQQWILVRMDQSDVVKYIERER